MRTSDTPRNPDIRRFFLAVPVSKVSVGVAGAVTLPIVAVVSLDAGPGQVGVLSAASTAAFLVAGLPAGAWMDRVRRRGVMVAAELVRALLLVSVPAAWLAGRLTFAHLLAVVLGAGVGRVFFDIGAQSYLPHLVGRGGSLARANAQLATIDSAASIGGPAAGGWLVGLVGAPVGVGLHAAAHVWSALWLARLKRPEPRADATSVGRMRTDIAEGLRFMVGQPILRAVTLAGALTNVALAAALAMLPLVLVRELGRSEAELGVFLAVGGVGGLLGAATSRFVASRLGEGRSLVVLGLAVGPAAVLVPLIGQPVPLWVANLGWLVVAYKVGYDNALLVTFRQQVTPHRLLGRVNAGVRMVLYGAVTIGGVTAAVVGETLGPRAALWVAAAIMACVWIPIVASPLRHVRTLSDPEVTV